MSMLTDMVEYLWQHRSPFTTLTEASTTLTFAGTEIKIYDAASTHYLSLKDDATNAVVSTDSGDIWFKPAGGDLRLYETAAVKYANWTHDGTNFKTWTSAGEYQILGTDGSTVIAAVTGVSLYGKNIILGSGGNLEIQATDNSQYTCNATSLGYFTDKGLTAKSENWIANDGTMTRAANNTLRVGVSTFTWTNAMVAALGATTSGEVTVGTLPAKFVVRNAYIIITGQGAGVTTLTVSLGITGAAYIDYIVAKDAKAAANTVYGSATGDRGTSLTGYHMPSYTGTTSLKCQFISTVENLSSTTGSTGIVVVEGYAIP